MDGLTVGEVAARAGVNPATLRYYERRGLLPRARRTASNYRVYGKDAVRWMAFIKGAQALGFSLEEIKDLLSLKVSPTAQCADVRERAVAKIGQIDGKVRSLTAMRAALSRLVAACAGEGPVSECPILDFMEAGGSG